MSNFFELYHQYTKSTEPPPNFHAWGAIGALSALLGKKCVIPQGKFDVYPNTYIVIVGTPGMRKGSPLNVAKNLVRSVDGVGVASDAGSREGMMDELAESKIMASFQGKQMDYWQAAIFVDEISDLLGGKHLDTNMVRFLTVIWDQMHYRERTRNGGEYTLHNPYLTIFGCTQPSWLQEKLSANVITEGFSRRVIFALEHERNKLNPWPENTDEDLRLLAMLKLEAKRIHSICGNFVLTKNARTYYDALYYSIMNKLEERPDKLQTYFSSRHILLLKISMCLSAAYGSERIINSNIIKLADAFLRQSERNLPAVYAGVGRNELKGYSDQVLDKIKAAGKSGLLKSELARLFYSSLGEQEFKEVLEMLQTMGEIKLLSAQGESCFGAVKTDPLPPALHLLELARLVEPCDEEILVETLVSEPVCRLARETQQHLSHLEQRRQQTTTGVLMKGKPSRLLDVL